MIHEVVKKHGGFLDFIYKDEEFAVKIKIPFAESFVANNF